VVAICLIAGSCRYNQIGVGGYVGPTALLLWDWLTPNQTAAVASVLGRSSYHGETGANLVWEAGNVLVDGLLSGDRNKSAAAAAASFTEITLEPGSTEGMKADGSFFQHGPQLYNGGYGQSFSFDIVNLLALCADTPLAATPLQRDTFAGWLLAGTLRMIVYGPSGPMWDVAVVGRDLTRPYGSSLQFGFGQSGQQVKYRCCARKVLCEVWSALLLPTRSVLRRFAPCRSPLWHLPLRVLAEHIQPNLMHMLRL
jgi:hypothetical protein